MAETIYYWRHGYSPEPPGHVAQYFIEYHSSYGGIKTFYFGEDYDAYNERLLSHHKGDPWPWEPSPPPPEEGKAVIINFEVPSMFMPNKRFWVTLGVRNDGGDDELFISVINKNTNETIISLGAPIATGSSSTWTTDITLTQTTDFHGRVEAGHIGNGEKVVDDTEDFTIPVSAPPPPECSPDGITKCEGYDLYQCQNGLWVLIEANSTTCGYVPPPPGWIKCYRCKPVGDGYSVPESKEFEGDICPEGWFPTQPPCNPPPPPPPVDWMQYLPYIIGATGVGVIVLALLIKKKKEK